MMIEGMDYMVDINWAEIISTLLHIIMDDELLNYLIYI